MIKVLIIDDAAVVRQVVTEVLDRAPDISVIGSAADPLFAMRHMEKQWPDVIVLDIEMPRMDGLTFLRKLMSERPTPVVILSSLTPEGSSTAIEALRAGAVQVLAKSKLGIKQGLLDDASNLIAAVQGAAQARVNLCRAQAEPAAPPPGSAPAETRPAGTTSPLINVRPKLSADVVLAPPAGEAMQHTTEQIVLIGASMGGTQALETILTRLGRTCPPIAITQHMPENFTAAFARRLDQLCKIDVREAVHGERMLRGTALIAPGGKHMMIRRTGAHYVVDIVAGPLVSRHCPSVDVLFRSGAKFAGRNAVGIILTGMGDDGAKGLKEMRDAGAHCYAQDEASCVVFGMPKEAIRLGAANDVLSLNRFPAVIEAVGLRT